MRVEILSGNKRDSNFLISLQRIREWTSKGMMLTAVIVPKRERLQHVVLGKRRLAESSLLYTGPLDNGDFSQLLQKNCFTGRTLPFSDASTDVAARARLWERRAGAGGRRGGALVVPVADEAVPRLLLDSSESRARDSEEDLFKESRLELLRGRDRLFKDDSRFVSLLPPPTLPLLLPLPTLLDRLLLPSDSRLESRGFDNDLPPQWLSRLESRGGLVSDLSDSLLSFLP